MELRQLEYFCRIVESGSIHEAARRLNMSQPPLSYQLKQLEQELHTALLMRTSKGVALTEAGQMLYQRACSLLEYARSTSREVSEAGKKRVLRLGITSTTVPTILPDIARFVRAHPDVNFECATERPSHCCNCCWMALLMCRLRAHRCSWKNVEYMKRARNQ